MNIREIIQYDLNSCAELFIEIFSNSPWNETWQMDAVIRRLSDCLHTPNFVGLLAENSGRIDGFAFGNIQYYGEEKHYYLLELCIRTDVQRSGVGTQIMEALKERMKREGIARIYTLTARETPAQTFYEKLGYYTSAKMVMMVQRL